MHSQKKAVVALAMLAIAALLGVWMLLPEGQAGSAGDQSPAAQPAAPAHPSGSLSPARAAWEPGSRYRHKVKLKMAFSDGSDGKRTTRVLVVGTWQTTALSSGRGLPELEVTFQPSSDVTDEEGYQSTPELRAQLQQTFVTRYDRSGAARELLFGPAVSPTAMGILRELATTFQVTLPESPANTWTATELDPGGEIEVSYTSTGRDQLLRREVRYLRVITAQGLTAVDRPETVAPRIESSEGRYRLDRQGRIESAEVRTSTAAVHPAAGWEFRTQVETSFRFLSRDFVGAPSAAPEGLAARGLTHDQESFEQAERQSLENLVNGASAGQLMQELRASRRDEKHEAVAATQYRLGALMRIDPKAVQAVAAQIRSGDYDQTLLGALAAAGTPEAQQVLLSVATGAAAGIEGRLAAIHASHSVQDPTDRTVGDLETLSKDADPQIKKDASFALGSMLGRRSASDPNSVKRKVEAMAAEYQGNTSADDRARVLDSLGNTGSPHALPTLELGMSDPDPRVRATAVKALRQIESPAADVLLARTLSSSEADLREAAVFAAGFRRFEPLAEALNAVVRAEKDRELRAKLLELVMVFVQRDQSTAALPLLTWIAQHDPDPELRAAAGKVLQERSKT